MDYDLEMERIDIPEELPLLAVRDVVVFPYMILPLFVGRDKSKTAVEKALEGDRIIFLASQRDMNVEEPGPEDIYTTGTAAMIMRMMRLPDGRLKILIQGLSKGVIGKYCSTEPIFTVRIHPVEENVPGHLALEAEALVRNVKDKIERILPLKNLPAEVVMITNNIDEPAKLADFVASNLRLSVDEAQRLLEMLDPLERLRAVDDLLAKEVEVSAMQARIQSQAKEEMSKSQREYFLREQLRAIKEELGEIDGKSGEIDEYREKIAKVELPEYVLNEAERQVSRLERMHPDAAEASMVRTYLDWLVDLPWSRGSKDTLDLKRAHEILDEDHAGLNKVKERILEYLGVRKLKKKLKGPILCFVGPPGVGKTSLGRSIARSMGRKFVRISLGGVKDEAEIRGHRRTYVGALPGRIIQSIHSAGTNNPVFMMDEVDKIGADFRGDPSSALLEVLDPEQNSSFSDHYLNLSFDLSRVMFITTANLLDPIPAALRDRMEIIRIEGYTHDEKMEIARNWLYSRQIEEHGLTEEHLTITAGAFDRIIEQYTREAGVRSLERKIGAVCRKVARRVAEGEAVQVTVSGSNLRRFLGPAVHLPEEATETDEVGVSTGLAWTQTGGEILRVEVTTMKGKGDLILTGQLGDVMKESAQAALSFTRSVARFYGVPDDFCENNQIHIHVPAGAIPKDGPSAGVAMACALVSALTRIPIDRKVAMTGEITLRGTVLPIGGLKDKTLAALRYGIGTICVPEANRKDLEEIPPKIRKKIELRFVKHMQEILDLALQSKGDRDTVARTETPTSSLRPPAKLAVT